MTFAKLAPEARRFFAGKVPYLAPVLFLFILPFPGTVALRLLSLGIAAAIAAWMWRRLAPPPIPLKLPIALWIVVSALSLVWALDPRYSLGEMKNEIGYTMVAFLTFYVLTQGEQQWRLWKYTFLVNACLVTFFAVYYEARGMREFLHGGEGHIGLHGGPGSFTTFYILLCPMLFIAIEESRGKGYLKGVPWLLLILMATGAYISQNRAFWLALAASVIAFTGLRLFRRTSRGKALKLTIISSIATLGVSATLLLAVIQSRFPAQTASGGLLEFLSRDPRLAVWKFSLEQICSHPLVGTGFGLGSAKSILDAQHFEDTQLWHAHNIFINYGLQMGIPGMVVLLIIFLAIAREFVQLYRSTDETCSKLGAAGLVMVVGLVVKCMTDVHLGRNNSLLFWALIGMILGYGRRLLAIERNRPSTTQPDSPMRQ